MKFPKALFWLPGSAAALCACGIGPVRQVRVFQASDIKGYSVQRVVVLPFVEDSYVSQGRPSSQVTAAFVQELRKRTPFEVIQLPFESLSELNPGDPARRGEYRTESLIAAGKRFRADALVYGYITALRPYFPQALGLRAEMVSIDTGATLWSVDALYDAADSDVENAVRLYYERESAHYSGTEDWRTVLASPARFAGFVASRCVDAMWAARPAQYERRRGG